MNINFLPDVNLIPLFDTKLQSTPVCCCKVHVQSAKFKEKHDKCARVRKPTVYLKNSLTFTFLDDSSYISCVCVFTCFCTVYTFILQKEKMQDKGRVKKNIHIYIHV